MLDEDEGTGRDMVIGANISNVKSGGEGLRCKQDGRSNRRDRMNWGVEEEGRGEDMLAVIVIIGHNGMGGGFLVIVVTNHRLGHQPA